ncbi:MAG: GDP-mannose 4,6-dehydratase [Alteromonadaceae bacterium]|nr:MAG: GDP-mannose 4,6-dehydratase [Alteromonadaceae bacterium]
MKKVAFITGITGQDGSYLAELLLSKGYEVHGMKRRSSSFNTGRIDEIYADPHLKETNMYLHFGDMTDGLTIHRLIAEIKPDEVYNLAAQSHVHVSFETPEYTANADALGTLRILEAVKKLGEHKSVRFYQAGTSEMFGKVEGTEKQSEKTPFYPRSPYGCSKLFAHWITVNYREAFDLFASNGILFNHESPRRGETFVTRKITMGLGNIFRGEQPHLALGNIDSIRDWGHARDYVEGMWRILQHNEPDDFVLATGVAISVRDFLIKACAHCGVEIQFSGSGLEETAKVVSIDKPRLEGFVGQSVDADALVGSTILKIDPYYFRPTEVEFLLGDSEKARTTLNWKPENNIDTLIDEMLSQDLKAS